MRKIESVDSQNVQIKTPYPLANRNVRAYNIDAEGSFLF